MSIPEDESFILALFSYHNISNAIHFQRQTQWITRLEYWVLHPQNKFISILQNDLLLRWLAIMTIQSDR